MEPFTKTLMADSFGAPLVCPITQGGNFARDRGFAVSLE
jgi:hypothetical protein